MQINIKCRSRKALTGFAQTASPIKGTLTIVSFASESWILIRPCLADPWPIRLRLLRKQYHDDKSTDMWTDKPWNIKSSVNFNSILIASLLQIILNFFITFILHYITLYYITLLHLYFWNYDTAEKKMIPYLEINWKYKIIFFKIDKYKCIFIRYNLFHFQVSLTNLFLFKFIDQKYYFKIK